LGIVWDFHVCTMGCGSLFGLTIRVWMVGSEELPRCSTVWVLLSLYPGYMPCDKTLDTAWR
jgi:hypothetical protein